MRLPFANKQFRTVENKSKLESPVKAVLLSGFAFAFAGIGGFWMLSNSTAQQASPTVYMKPANRTLGPSTAFSVQIRVNSGSTGINAVQADFTYPTNLVEVVSIDSAGSAFPVEAFSNAAAGKVTVARGTIGSLTGDQLVATVNLRTLTMPAPAASLTFVSGTEVIDAANNVNVLSMASATGATIKIDATPTTIGRGDINGDKVVNITDLSLMIANWGKPHHAADFSGDGVVGVMDLSVLLVGWSM